MNEWNATERQTAPAGTEYYHEHMTGEKCYFNNERRVFINEDDEQCRQMNNSGPLRVKEESE